MKTIEELTADCETYRELLEKARAWLSNFKERIEELEKNCDSYAAYIKSQDEEIAQLERRLAQQDEVSTIGSVIPVADLTEVQIENEQLRQRLVDLNEYLETTRRDGVQFYL